MSHKTLSYARKYEHAIKHSWNSPVGAIPECYFCGIEIGEYYG